MREEGLLLLLGLLLARPCSGWQVAVTPAVSPAVNGGHHLPSRGVDDVVIDGSPWTGRICRDVKEGIDELLLNGLAVFESEEAMFAGGAAGDAESPFCAKWLKNTPSVNLLSGNPPRYLTAPFAAFATRLQTILDAKDRDAFARVNEDFVSVIVVGGPVTRGGDRKGNTTGAKGSSNVFSIHQDPCFFASLNQTLNRAAEDGPDQRNSLCTRYPYDAVASVVDDGDITVRQINFWLPHERDGEKYLLLLSRHVSALIAERVGDIEEGIGEKNSDEGGFLRASCTPSTASENNLVVKKPNGNRWLTRRGLSFMTESLGGNLSGHAFLVNKPVMFVSANAGDTTDPIFHCGAVIGEEVDEEAGSAYSDRGHRSTELRLAVCSRRKPTSRVLDELADDRASGERGNQPVNQPAKINQITTGGETKEHVC